MIDFQPTENQWASQEVETWNLWGYIRSSSNPQINSPEVQAKKIARMAIQILPELKDRLAKWMTTNVFVDQAESAYSIRYYDRPEFKRLMEHIQVRDRLIVWRTDRIDRDDGEQIKALNWLGHRKIWLYVEEMGVQPLDLGRVANRLAPKLMAIASQFVEAQKIQASVDAKNFLAEKGVYRHGHDVAGYRRIVPVWNGRRGTPHYRHDEAERLLIREIGGRVRWGTHRGVKSAVGVWDVFHDFQARGELTAAGKPWSRDRIRRLAIWWLGCVDLGLEPWVDRVPYDVGVDCRLSVNLG